MPTYALYVADVIAIAILVFGLFLPRHRRPELVVAFLTVNVGVLAVSAALSSSTIGAGLGLGLFGILSIIRLRSEELAQSEIAYYFAALALGLLSGIDQSPTWVDIALMTAVLAAVAIGDTIMSTRRTESQQLLLDRAITDRTALIAHLEGLLGAEVVSVSVLRTDLVDDTTLVAVRYHPGTSTEMVPQHGIPQQEMLR
ncbi:permease [Nocardioides sp. Root190]|uniref:DUF4956 domain-containing protein n=1 Tax=Nocardioides sp. Root190 TaxID=1736488 RepID=UPI0007014A26|nr:DUF4956 domain-containing protein [Nocardioides sp. Root190]KRB75021.1 permease [Nocardioides sp. Root190]